MHYPRHTPTARPQRRVVSFGSNDLLLDADSALPPSQGGRGSKTVTVSVMYVVLCTLLLLIGHPAAGDIIETVDRGMLTGKVTLGDDGQLRIAPADGEPITLPGYDVFQINFGEGLTIRAGDIMLIDNDGMHTARARDASIKLRAGLHHIVLPYWQGDGAGSVELRVTGPGFNGSQPIPEEALYAMRRSADEIPQSGGIDGEGFRRPELPLSAIEQRQVRSRVRYRFYTATQPEGWRDMSCFNQMQLKRSGTSSEIADHVNGGQTEWYGLVFEGFVRIPQDGTYTFILTSDDGSQLFLGQPTQFNASLPVQTDRPTWRVRLKPGGELRGDLNQFDKDRAVVSIPVGENQTTDLTVTLDRVAEMWPAGPLPMGLSRDNESQTLDTVYVRDRDDPNEVRGIAGKVLGMDDQSLTIFFRGEPRQLNRDRIAGVVLNHPDRPAPAPPGFHQVLALRTGQELAGRLTALDEQTIGFELLGGGQVTAPRGSVAFLRYEQGRVIDLTRIEPTASEDIPYFDTAFPYQVNQAIGGGEIRLFNGPSFKRGLSVHARSRLHYRLDSEYATFRATLGLLEPGGRMGNITARVLGDGEVLWEQADITAENEPIDVQVDLDGVGRLVLEVDFGRGQNVGDRAAWCDPQLIRERVPE